MKSWPWCLIAGAVATAAVVIGLAAALDLHGSSGAMLSGWVGVFAWWFGIGPKNAGYTEVDPRRRRSFEAVLALLFFLLFSGLALAVPLVVDAILFRPPEATTVIAASIGSVGLGLFLLVFGALMMRKRFRVRRPPT